MPLRQIERQIQLCDKQFAERSYSDSFQRLWTVCFKKFQIEISLFQKLFSHHISAGVEQQHYVHNALNILVNEGFLRNQQGAQSLEAVQKFYNIIKQPMRKATMHFEDLNSKDYCPDGKSILEIQAVIVLFQEDSKTNEVFFHAAKVSINSDNVIFRLFGWKNWHP